MTLEPTLVKWLRMGGDLYPITNWKTRELKIRRKAKLEGLGRWGWGRDIMRHTYATMHVAKFSAEHKASRIWAIMILRSLGLTTATKRLILQKP